MTSNVVIGLGMILGLMVLLNAAGLWAVHSEKYRKYRIATPVVDRPPAGQRVSCIALNSTVSLSFYCVCLYFGSTFLIEDNLSSIGNNFLL